jgi:hypothetical protein
MYAVAAQRVDRDKKKGEEIESMETKQRLEMTQALQQEGREFFVVKKKRRKKNRHSSPSR